jgi:MFS family permease
MMISVLMMCFGSLLIACLPTYASIGVWAPLLLLFARLLQGLSVGGEYGTTATYMSEVALKGQRGFLRFVPVRDPDRRPTAGGVAGGDPATVPQRR